MPALKIHSNREYIDSFVIELSLSFLCHNSHGSLSRLMYYQKHATPLPLFLSGTHNYLFFSHSRPLSVFYTPSLSCFAWQPRENVASKINVIFQIPLKDIFSPENRKRASCTSCSEAKSQPSYSIKERVSTTGLRHTLVCRHRDQLQRHNDCQL